MALRTPAVSPTNVVSTMPTNITGVVTADNFNLAWPAGHTGWQLQVQTNGLGTNWVNIANSTLTNEMTFPIDREQSAVFFRLVYPL